MKNVIMMSAALVAVLMLFVAVQASAQEMKKSDKGGEVALTGYVVDKMCAAGMVKRGAEQALERAAKHTKQCALEEGCRESGYGLVMGAMYHKFDAKGDSLALAYLQKTKKERGHYVEVKGKMENDLFMVTSLEEVAKDTKGQGGSKEAGKKM